MLRFHTQTAGLTLQAQQPLVNVVRTTIAGARRGAGRRAVAAHQQLRRGARAADRGGGAHRAAHAAGDRRTRAASPTSSIRSAAATPSSRSPRDRGARDGVHRARSTSWAAWSRAIEQGYPQREIERRAYEHQRAVESRRADRRRRERVRRRRRHAAAAGRCTARSGTRGRAGRACWRRSERSATEQDARRARRAERRPRAGPTTWCRRSSRPSRRVPRWARSPTCCATSSGNTAPDDRWRARDAFWIAPPEP